MMGYIFDDSALVYMLETFPRKAVPNLFATFCDKCTNGDVICEKETRKSLDNLLEEEFSFEWLKENNKLFRSITQKESKILGELIDRKLFEFVNKSKSFTRNIPITIPFVLAIAINEDRTIVVDKKSRNYDTIKKLCEKTDAEFIEIDDFLSQISL